MSRLGKIARRTFLIGSAAIAGGVAFGYYMYKRPPHNPLLDDLAEGEAALTPYVKIDANGITLITPRADMGQGAYSVQAALLAEELDVDLDQVRVDPGPPDPAYYNTALSQEAVPFYPTDTSWMAETSRGVADALMKFIGMQITGGSTTVPDGYQKLRVAGAVARETLKQAASNKTGVHITRLKTERASVILPEGEAIPYTELAQLAATLEPVEQGTLRDPSEWRLIGKPMQRVDIVEKSTGTARYGIDIELDGMLHAAVKLNPHIGGNVNSYDASAALAMNGVRSVVPVQGGVAVVANNTWRAFQAADAIVADWGPSPMPETMESHWAALSDAFSPDHQDSRNRDDGDVDAAISVGPVTAEYRAPYLAHAPLEPINATVLVGSGRVDVWTGTQVPRFVQEALSKVTNVDASDIHVHVQMIGGSFGHRLEMDVVIQAAEIAMTMQGTPVKLTYSREQDMTHDFTRPAVMARARGQIDDGKISALDLGIASPSVMASQMGRIGMSLPGPDAQIVAGAWEQPFDIPNYRVTGYRAQPLAPISSWRSVGASTNAFFHESFFDELCHSAGIDPVMERLRLCNDDTTRKVLETIAEMSNWGSPMAANRGRGIAFCMSFGTPVAEVVEVTNTPDGIKIDQVFVAADVGRIIDPVNFDALVKGGVIWGLGHAMMGEITYAKGASEQENFDTFTSLRLYQTPKIEVRGLENGAKVRGIGEPPVPPAAPALANAIFAATGQRLRDMPFRNAVNFV